MYKAIMLCIVSGLAVCMLFAAVRLTPIENFDSGTVTLSSWADEDIEPYAWALDTDTPDSSAYSLKLTGNTWKLQQIIPYAIDSIGVVQVRVKPTPGSTTNIAKVQGIGFTDGVHELFYSFAGNRVVNIEAWVPVYQGALTSGQWNTYQLPLASDWQAFWGYLPVITGIIYVNDLDGITVSRTVLFDAISDISEDLPVAPAVTITAGPPTRAGRDVGIQFNSTVYDPDSAIFAYSWAFGDSTGSTLANPYHVFTDADAHPYTVSLVVTDQTGKQGYASVVVNIDQGTSTLPVTMNFVGDVMLARAYEATGGIIPTQGVNAIFTPTKPLFGDAAEINVANLEVILSNVGEQHPTKSVAYRGNPANISGLVYAGIDVVTLANNHTLDWGLDALQQMTGLLDDAGILYSGAGADSYEAYLPAFVNKRGLNIAFLRSCDRTGQYNNAQPYLQAGFNKPGFAYMTPYYISRQLEAVEDVADLKIVEMHGGSEYSLTPGAGYDKGNPFLGDTQDEDYTERTDVPHQWDIAIRHSAIDSGADMVIVHHPHIIQGLEIYNGKLIAHSLGNYVFDLDYPETMPSMILYADAYPTGFANYRVKPLFIDGYIPRPASGQLGIYILDYLARRSRELDTYVWVDRENMEAKVLDGDLPPVTVNAWTTTEQLMLHQNDYHYSNPVKLPRSGSIASINAVQPVADAELRLGAEMVWFGNFENEGTSFWAPPAYSTTDVLDGARSALLSCNTATSVTSTIPKRTKLYDNTRKYTLHGWMKTNNATTANIIIRYYALRTTGTAISTESVTTNITGTTGWTYYFKEITIPSNAYYYDIRLSLTGTIGSSTALFDNVGLIEWTQYANASSLADIAWPNNYYWMQARTTELAKSITISMAEKEFNGNRPRYTGLAAPAPKLNLYPNPFNPLVNISIDIPKSSLTELSIYNIRGQLVKRLVSEELPAGKHSYQWDSKDNHSNSVSSGIYFIKVQSGGRTELRKAILMK